MGRRSRPGCESRDSGTDRGASAVEFAILLPLFVMFALGIVTGGQAYATKIGLTQAAREGARFGATLPVPPAPGKSLSDWLYQVRDATLSASGGDFVAGQDQGTLCVAFIDGQDTSKSTRLTIGTSGTSTTQAGSCWADAITQGDNRVQVLISRKVDLNIGVKSWTPTVTTRSVIHHERSASL